MNKVTLTISLIVLIVIAMLFETTIVVVPLVYLMGAFLLIFWRRVRIYIVVFLLALFMDSLRITNFGITPLFLAALCGIIFIYEKYSGSDDAIVSSFLIAVSSIIYAHFLQYSVFFTSLLLCVAGAGWYLFYWFQKRERFL